MAIEQEHNRPNEIHYRDSPELRQQVNTSKVVQRFLPRQTDQNKILKCIERKMLKSTLSPVTIRDTSRVFQ